MLHLYSLDESVNPLSNGIHPYRVEFDAFKEKNNALLLTPKRITAIVWARYENDAHNVINDHFDVWSNLAIKDRPELLPQKKGNIEDGEALPFLYIDANPLRTGNHAFLIRFTRPASGPVPIIPNDSNRFTPATTMMAVAYASSEDRISAVLDYHYPGWCDLDVIKQSQGSRKHKPKQEVRCGL